MQYNKSNGFEHLIIRANSELPMNEVILQQGDTNIMSVGDISVIAGQPKSRKTFLVAAICAAFLSDDGYLGLKTNNKGKLLLIDTEQSKPFVLTVVQRIYKILNWDINDPHDSEITVLTMRELNANERLKTMHEAICLYKPKLIMLDGFADLLADTNSLEESTEKVSKLMLLSSKYNCHICSVLHTNPGSEKMRGHTGSELQRKSESVLLVTKSDDVSTVSPQFCRNLEFSKFSFKVNSNGLPVPCEYTLSNEDSLQILFETIFMSSPVLSYADLKKEIMTKKTIQSTAAENWIRKGKEKGILTKDVNSFYSLKINED